MRKIETFNEGDYVKIRPDIAKFYKLNGLVIGKRRAKVAGQYFYIRKKYYIGNWLNKEPRYYLEGLGNTPFSKSMFIKPHREENEL